jgi:hypothetical protein
MSCVLCMQLLVISTFTAIPQQAPGAVRVDARAEVAAALFAASATHAAAERAANDKLRAQRVEIERLQVQVRSGLATAAQLRTTLTTAQEQYVAALAARDRTYAQEIAIFRSSVQDIAATTEGAAALAQFNSGDEAGALSILDRLRAARTAARQQRADLEDAAEGRRVAELALEARNRGKTGDRASDRTFRGGDETRSRRSLGLDHSDAPVSGERKAP